MVKTWPLAPPTGLQSRLQVELNLFFIVFGVERGSYKVRGKVRGLEMNQASKSARWSRPSSDYPWTRQA